MSSPLSVLPRLRTALPREPTVNATYCSPFGLGPRGAEGPSARKFRSCDLRPLTRGRQRQIGSSATRLRDEIDQPGRLLEGIAKPCNFDTRRLGPREDRKDALGEKIASVGALRARQGRGGCRLQQVRLRAGLDDHPDSVFGTDRD